MQVEVLQTKRSQPSWVKPEPDKPGSGILDLPRAVALTGIESGHLRAVSDKEGKALASRIEKRARKVRNTSHTEEDQIEIRVIQARRSMPSWRVGDVFEMPVSLAIPNITSGHFEPVKGQKAERAVVAPQDNTSANPRATGSK